MSRFVIVSGCVLMLTGLAACGPAGGAPAAEAAQSANPAIQQLEAHFASAQPPERRIVLTTIGYEPGEYALPKEAAPLMAEVGRILAAHPDAIVRLESYAKESGTDADLHLAAKRALYVGKALEKAGAPKKHLFPVSWDPISSSDAQMLGPLVNGRTDLVIYTKAGFERPS